jgi:hypothetical protein
MQPTFPSTTLSMHAKLIPSARGFPNRGSSSLDPSYSSSHSSPAGPYAHQHHPPLKATRRTITFPLITPPRQFFQSPSRKCNALHPRGSNRRQCAIVWPSALPISTRASPFGTRSRAGRLPSMMRERMVAWWHVGQSALWVWVSKGHGEKRDGPSSVCMRRRIGYVRVHSRLQGSRRA